MAIHFPALKVMCLPEISSKLAAYCSGLGGKGTFSEMSDRAWEKQVAVLQYYHFSCTDLKSWIRHPYTTDNHLKLAY